MFVRSCQDLEILAVCVDDLLQLFRWTNPTFPHLSSSPAAVPNGLIAYLEGDYLINIC